MQNQLQLISQPYQTSKLHILPLRDRPAYKVAANPASCSLVELFAAIIRGKDQVEKAEAVLAYFGGDIRRIYNAHPEEIARTKGISLDVAVSIKAAFAAGLRLTEPDGERKAITSPADAAAMVQYEMGLLQQEYLKVFLLNTRNQVVDILEMYHGSVNCSQVRIAEIFKPAIQRMAPAIILAHNHPSNDPTPSPDDVALTRAVVQAGKLLDVALLDHLIICKDRWISLKERCLGFS
jgi:DNA repair protein RadC